MTYGKPKNVEEVKAEIERLIGEVAYLVAYDLTQAQVDAAQRAIVALAEVALEASRREAGVGDSGNDYGCP